MGEVLYLRDHAGRQPERSGKIGSAASGGAEVVIYPGVRVEHHTIDLSVRKADSAGRTGGGNGKGKRA